MKRRFVLAVVLSVPLIGTPLVAEAQQAGKIPRVGYLSEFSPPQPDVRHPFFEALRELGWVDGQNIVIEQRWAQGRFERLPDLARDLVRLKVDVIVAGFSRVTAAAAVALKRLRGSSRRPPCRPRC